MLYFFVSLGFSEEWESPYGLSTATVGGLFATRYLYETGALLEQPASVVVSMRKWAALNTNAVLLTGKAKETVVK